MSLEPALFYETTEANEPERLVWEIECLLKTMIASCDTRDLLEALDNSEVNTLFKALHTEH